MSLGGYNTRRDNPIGPPGSPAGTGREFGSGGRREEGMSAGGRRKGARELRKVAPRRARAIICVTMPSHVQPARRLFPLSEVLAPARRPGGDFRRQRSPQHFRASALSIGAAAAECEMVSSDGN